MPVASSKLLASVGAIVVGSLYLVFRFRVVRLNPVYVSIHQFVSSRLKLVAVVAYFILTSPLASPCYF